MKLYTEEQVLRMMELARFSYVDEDNILFSFTPIELPTEEEMKEYVYDNITPPSLDKANGVEQMYFDTGFYVGFRAFAKWMRDKIQGGN